MGADPFVVLSDDLFLMPLSKFNRKTGALGLTLCECRADFTPLDGGRCAFQIREKRWARNEKERRGRGMKEDG